MSPKSSRSEQEAESGGRVKTKRLECLLCKMDHQNRKLRSLSSIRFRPNMEEQKEVSRLSSIEIISAEDLAAMPLAPPLFVVDGLIPQGVSLLSGASKTGKSWLMLRLGLQVSQGLPLWDLPTHRCGVLYLSLENTHIRLLPEVLFQVRFQAALDRIRRHGKIEVRRR